MVTAMGELIHPISEITHFTIGYSFDPQETLSHCNYSTLPEALGVPQSVDQRNVWIPPHQILSAIQSTSNSRLRTSKGRIRQRSKVATKWHWGRDVIPQNGSTVAEGISVTNAPSQSAANVQEPCATMSRHAKDTISRFLASGDRTANFSIPTTSCTSDLRMMIMWIAIRSWPVTMTTCVKSREAEISQIAVNCWMILKVSSLPSSLRCDRSKMDGWKEEKKN